MSDRARPFAAPGDRVSALDDAAVWAAGEVREGRALHRLVAELDDAQRASLRRVALVVLRPHALQAGDGAAIVRALADELGARPVAIRVLPRLSPALVGALYARQAKIPRGRLWLQEEAFAGGPAAALLVACDEAPEPSLTERLYALKGPSSALEPATGSLRARFGRTNSLHAVLHVPDDLRNLVIEATLLFSWTRLAAAGDAPRLGLDLVETLVALEPLPGRLVFAAVLKVKLRILAAVAVSAGRDVVAALWELTARAGDELADLPYLAQRDRLLAFAAAEREPLAQAIEHVARLWEPSARERSAEDVAAHSRPPTFAGTGPGAAGRILDMLWAARLPAELLIASWWLSGHEAYANDGGDAVFAILDAGGMPLSAAQRSLIATALSTDLHPAARVGGERLWPLGPDPAA